MSITELAITLPSLPLHYQGDWNNSGAAEIVFLRSRDGGGRALWVMVLLTAPVIRARWPKVRNIFLLRARSRVPAESNNETRLTNPVASK